MPGDTPMQFPFPYKTTDGSGGSGIVKATELLLVDNIQSFPSSEGIVIDSVADDSYIHLKTDGVTRVSIDEHSTTIEQFENATTYDATTGALRVKGGVSIQDDVYIGGNLFMQNQAEPWDPVIEITGSGSFTQETGVGSYVEAGDSTVIFDFLVTASYTNVNATEIKLVDLPLTNEAGLCVITNVSVTGVNNKFEGPFAFIVEGTTATLYRNSEFSKMTLVGSGSSTIRGTGILFKAGTETYSPALSASTGSVGTITLPILSGDYEELVGVTTFTLGYEFTYSGSSASGLRVSLPTTATSNSFCDNIYAVGLGGPIGGTIANGTNYISLINISTNEPVELTGSGSAQIYITGFYHTGTPDTRTPTLAATAGNIGSINYSTQIGKTINDGVAYFATVDLAFTHTGSTASTLILNGIPRINTSPQTVIVGRGGHSPLGNVDKVLKYVATNENLSLDGNGSGYLRFSQAFVGGVSSANSLRQLTLTKSTGVGLSVLSTSDNSIVTQGGIVSKGKFEINKEPEAFGAAYDEQMLIETGINGVMGIQGGIQPAVSPADSYAWLGTAGNKNIKLYNDGRAEINTLYVNALGGDFYESGLFYPRFFTGRSTVDGGVAGPLGYVIPYPNEPCPNINTYDGSRQYGFYEKWGSAVTITFELQARTAFQVMKNNTVHISGLPFEKLEDVEQIFNAARAHWVFGSSFGFDSFYLEIIEKGTDAFTPVLAGPPPWPGFDGCTMTLGASVTTPALPLGTFTAPGIHLTGPLLYYDDISTNRPFIKFTFEYFTNGTRNPNFDYDYSTKLNK